MELFLIIILVAVGYWIYKAIQQNSPEAKIARLEDSAEEFYPAVVKEAEDSVKKWEKELASVKRVVIEKQTISQKQLTEMKRFKGNFSGFMEEHKNASSDEKMKFMKFFLRSNSTVIPREVSFRSESGTEKKEIIKLLEITRNKLKEIREFRDNYLRLKERHKLDSGVERIALAQDYFDYYYTRKQINSEFNWLNYALEKNMADDIYEKMRELDIKAEEILKRFDKKLALN